jgi:LPXTG-motif cell wall-anchored protein
LKRLLYLATLSIMALLIFAPAASAQDEMTVSIQDFFFEPDQLTVAPGTTVTWVNDGEEPHTSTADDGTWDSGTLQPGESYSFTFDDPGDYSYLCEIHPDMTATITVSEDGEMTTASPEATTMSPSASATASATATASPTASASANMKHNLPDTGGVSLPILAAAALLGLGVLALISMRRAS